MQFQLSVYYQDAFLSYLITSEDKVSFHFHLKSAPGLIVPAAEPVAPQPPKGVPGSAAAPAAEPVAGVSLPDDFIVNHPAPDEWIFDRDLDKDFKHGIVQLMKKTRL